MTQWTVDQAVSLMETDPATGQVTFKTIAMIERVTATGMPRIADAPYPGYPFNKDGVFGRLHLAPVTDAHREQHKASQDAKDHTRLAEKLSMTDWSKLPLYKLRHIVGVLNESTVFLR